jgi:ribosomal protein L37AE/L43A
MGIRLTKDARAETVQLYKAGWSMTAIARYMGVTRDTIRRIVRSAGLRVREPRRGLVADAGRSERAWVQIKQEIRDLQRCPACLGKTLEVQVQGDRRVVRCRDADCQFTWIRPALAEAVSSVSSTADSIASKEVNHDGRLDL